MKIFVRAAIGMTLFAGWAFVPVGAQQSTSYQLDEHVFNAGGHPQKGQTLTSTSFEVSLDSVGDGLTGRGLSSGSYRMDVGFVPAYPPPGEVSGLRFVTNDSTLEWDPEPSVGSYDLYRDLLGNLSGLGFGQCLQQSITETTATDADLPAGGDGFFYLVTAENRIGEKGTKGFQTSGAERGGAVCP